MKYDYLIVGSGLFGATFAYKAKKSGKKCLVANFKGELYNLPFNMNIFNKMWPDVHPI